MIYINEYNDSNDKLWWLLLTTTELNKLLKFPLNRLHGNDIMETRQMKR